MAAAVVVVVTAVAALAFVVGPLALVFVAAEGVMMPARVAATAATVIAVPSAKVGAFQFSFL